jgi:hypothetical protein
MSGYVMRAGSLAGLIYVYEANGRLFLTAIFMLCAV